MNIPRNEALPERIGNVDELDELLSRPDAATIETLSRIDGDIIVLGVAGKMGPTLARMAKRASELVGAKRRVIGVSRFSNAEQSDALNQHGIDTYQCDLLDEESVQHLPAAPNVIYMAGMKFGSSGNEPLTWAMNTGLPAIVCRKFCRSRIVAFSTGNIYGLTSIQRGGSTEADAPQPVGEYAMSCLGRERMFEYFSSARHIPVILFRLNYACELRYGVLVDIAQRVWRGETVDLAMGRFNTIWQGDANAVALRSLAHAASPPLALNVTGPELMRVRDVAEQFGALMKKSVSFTGVEGETALLSNSSRARQMFGEPQVPVAKLISWVANWVSHDGASLGKPTHFESREGKF
jgi:hypothetical protein